MERNLVKTDEKTEVYLGNKIVAWVDRWEEFNEIKQKWENRKQVYCHLYRTGSKWQPLNLGECNDGSKFTAVNQAVNQAKEFVNYFNYKCKITF